MAKKKKNKFGGQQFLSDEQFVRQRMRALQVGDCYITDSLMESGEGYVVVSRFGTYTKDDQRRDAYRLKNREIGYKPQLELEETY